MWHPTEEMLTRAFSIFIPIILASIVALYLIMRFVPWKEWWKVVKVVTCLVSVAAFCFSGYALLNLVASYVDYNAREAEYSAKKTENPLWDTDWYNDGCRFSVFESPHVDFYYRADPEDESSTYVHVYGSYVYANDEEAAPYIEQSEALLKDFDKYPHDIYVFKIKPERMTIDTKEFYVFENDFYVYCVVDYVHPDDGYDFVVLVDPERQIAKPMIPFPSFDKPVIYLYPEKDTKVNVQLSKPENITCDYPEYNRGWNVMAKANGDLKDLQSGRDLYCLYYESAFEGAQVESDGFVVKSADVADFLDEKLDILGLNDKERNEFIIYWLPILEANEYNYIRFLTEDEINEVQQFDITPKPDTVIRVMMSYKGLDKPIEVKEQELKTAERAGFTVVEWGGTEIK